MFPWCEQARQLVGPGILEHSRLWRRLATAASTSSRFLQRESHAGGVEEERWKFCTRIAPAWTCTRACPRESGGYGRRLRAPHGDRLGRARGAHLQDDDQGFARPVRL